MEKFLGIKLEYLGYIIAITDKMTGTNNQDVKLRTMSEVYNRLIKVFNKR